jgi:GNAT superfamily N-acetyltransferase
MFERRLTLKETFPEDLPFLARLYYDTRRQEVGAWGWSQEQQELFLRMQFEAQSRSYRAAFPDATDRIICLEGAHIGRMLTVQEPAGIRLIDIALLDEHRNRGIGTELLRRLQQEGCSLRLQVLQGNPAIRLYQRLGFVQIDADLMYVQMEWIPFREQERSCMSEKLILQDFVPHRFTRFRVAQLENYELELAEVNDHSNAQVEQFSLIFTGVASPWLQQGLYTLVHPQMRECELFLVPIGPDAAGMRYEAAFSRLIHTPATMRSTS